MLSTGMGNFLPKPFSDLHSLRYVLLCRIWKNLEEKNGQIGMKFRI